MLKEKNTGSPVKRRELSFQLVTAVGRQGDGWKLQRSFLFTNFV
jgi:hypothetical protein